MRVHGRGGASGGAAVTVTSYISRSATILANVAPGANTLKVGCFVLTASLQFSNIVVNVTTADAVNLYDFGIYNSSGTLVADAGAQHIPSTGIQAFPVIGAPITLSAGTYFLAFTGNAATMTIQQDIDGIYPFWGDDIDSSSGGQLPASITAPVISASTLNAKGIPFALF